MPAFGNEGMVNLNQSANRTMYKLMSNDGKVIACAADRELIESQKREMESKGATPMSIVETKVGCI